MEIDMSDELKPCPNPWCEQSDVRCIGWKFYSRFVFCTCGVSGPRSALKSLDGSNVDALNAEAIFAWNTRADLPPTPEQIAADPRVQKLVEAGKFFAAWDHCYPGNINLETAHRKMVSALAEFTTTTTTKETK